MTLRAARILSSETDNTIKQEQNTNVNIKITPRQQQQQQPVPGNVNFTQANQPQDSLPAGQALHTQTTPESLQYPSAAVTNSNSLLAQDRGIRLPGSLRTESVADLGLELGSSETHRWCDSLEKKNRFLELLVEMYSENPLKVNSYVVCKSGTLMSMIKLLTECDKVDFVLDDYEVGCGCSASTAKLIKIDKILVTKDGRTEELKYCYNDIYTEFIKYGISLKLCC